jgi:hypothetical protein
MRTVVKTMEDLKINLKQFGPKNTYIRNGEKCYFDSFRQMLVPCTPESLLLLKMEMYVHQVMGVPKNMMYMNQSFRKYGIDSSKLIDIVIHDNIDGDIKPVAIVECKSPDMALYHSTTSHIEDFAKKVGINYLIVTNGTDVDSYISREDRLSFWKIDNVPDYEIICNGHKAALAAQFAANPGSQAKKFTKKLEPALKFSSKTTPKAIQPIVMNLVKCLNDTHNRLKPQTFDQITVVGDCGQRRKLTGFGSEKHGKIMLRTLLIKDFYDNHQLVSFDINPDLLGAPILSVTLDDYDSRQVILSMDLNTCLIADEQKINFGCDLNKAFPHEDAEFSKELKNFISLKAPYLLKGHEVRFGEIHLIDPIKMDEEETAQAFVNVVAYALLLDEYRARLKSASKEFKKNVKK